MSPAARHDRRPSAQHRLADIMQVEAMPSPRPHLRRGTAQLRLTVAGCGESPMTGRPRATSESAMGTTTPRSVARATACDDTPTTPRGPVRADGLRDRNHLHVDDYADEGLSTMPTQELLLAAKPNQTPNRLHSGWSSLGGVEVPEADSRMRQLLPGEAQPSMHHHRRADVKPNEDKRPAQDGCCSIPKLRSVYH